MRRLSSHLGVVVFVGLWARGVVAGERGSLDMADPVERPEPEQPHVERFDGRPAPNSIFLELGGAGVIYSLNYERFVLDDLPVRIGFTFFGWQEHIPQPDFGEVPARTSQFFALPVTASYLGIGSGSHAMELGAGITVFDVKDYSPANFSPADGGGMLGTLFTGYRLQPRRGGGFQFRFGALLRFERYEDLLGRPGFQVAPWGYLSLGGGF